MEIEIFLIIRSTSIRNYGFSFRNIAIWSFLFFFVRFFRDFQRIIRPNYWLFFSFFFLNLQSAQMTLPIRSNSSGSSVNSPSALGNSSSMANPYAMTPLYHSPGVQSYCGPSDNLSLAGHYTDMRSSAGWYGSTANDPRFASEYSSTSSNSNTYDRLKTHTKRHKKQMSNQNGCGVELPKPKWTEVFIWYSFIHKMPISN